MRRAVIGRIKKISPLFHCFVAIPTLISIIYFGFLASNIFISESRFVVRAPDKPATSGLGVLLKTAGFSNAGDEVYAAQDFLKSRDALQALNRKGAFQAAYTNESISIFDRFGSFITGDTFEDLYDYYRGKIKVEHETNSSITTLVVKAYAPQDAQIFNERLLEMAEATVNKLNERGRSDLVRYASGEVEDAKKQALQAAFALSAYRNQEGVVDPEKQATVQLQMISKIQDELIAARTTLRQYRAFTPENSQIEVLEVKTKSLEREMEQSLLQVAGDRKSLSSAAAHYQRLVLDNQFAEKQLAAAMSALQEAKSEARRKQAYVERIVQPNRPDKALEPKRLKGVAATFLLGLVLWGIVGMLIAGINEHRG